MTDEPTPRGLERTALDAALKIAPFHKWLRLRVLASGHGLVEIEMPWRKELVSNPRISSVHGGVLASLVDLAGMYAVLTQTTDVTATAGLNLDYLRPATSGPITARAKVVRLGRTLSVATTEVFGPDGAQLACGRGAYLMRQKS